MEDGKVKVTVTGTGELTGDESVVTISEGELKTMKLGRYVFYQVEDENEKGKFIKHRLKLGDKSLELLRGSTKVTYAPGKLCPSNYETPYGLLHLNFYTKLLEFTEKDFIRVNLTYDIKMEEEILSSNKLEIMIEKE